MEVDFGAWLGRQLQRREWTAADFARRLRTGNSTVTMWLHNQRTPSTSSSDKIADVLGVDADLVLAMAGHRPLDDEIDPESVAARIMSLVARVHWNDDRIAAIEGPLQAFIDADKRKARQ